MASVPPPLPASGRVPPPQGWWQRHWKWAVPALAGAAALRVALSIAGVLLALRSVIVASAVYQDALDRARADARVVAHLDDAIAPGALPVGAIETSSAGGGSGRAAFVIRLEGSTGAGMLHVEAHRWTGSWICRELTFAADAAPEPIDIVSAGTPVSASVPATP